MQARTRRDEGPDAANLIEKQQTYWENKAGEQSNNKIQNYKLQVQDTNTGNIWLWLFTDKPNKILLVFVHTSKKKKNRYASLCVIHHFNKGKLL